MLSQMENKNRQITSIVQNITTLLETIKKCKSEKPEGTKSISETDISELQQLKTKCGDANPIISLTASQGIVSLVQDGVLPIGSTLSDLIVSLSTAECSSGITMAIGSLLLLDMRRSLDYKKTYSCPFNLQKNQHPFIKVLSQKKDVSTEVLNQMQIFFKHFDEKILSNSLELLRPVLFFILCKPVDKFSEVCRKNLWNMLVTIADSSSIIFELVAWIKVNDKQNCLDVCDYLTVLSQLAPINDPDTSSAIAILLGSLLLEIVKEGCDPTSYVRTIMETLKLPGTESTHSVILILLSETIATCPPVFLREVLYLCNFIVTKRSANILSVKYFVSTLIQWFLYPSCLLSESMKIAKDVLTFIEINDEHTTGTHNLLRNKHLKYLTIANFRIDFVLKLSLLAETWQDDPKFVHGWLNEMEAKHVPVNLFNFISSIFINDFDDFQRHRRRTLRLLTRIVKVEKSLTSNLLILILYKLHDEKDPETQVDLLRTIPEMAVLRENMPLVLTTLSAIANEKNCLRPLALTLYLRLFLTEVRSFPYLQKLLLEPCKDYEFNVVKAQTLKEICSRKPDLHGKEMVGHLAQVLNKNGDQKGSLPSALAIEGIATLCEAGIIDIASTWTSLSPKFSKEKRLLVINSLCDFFGGFSDLRANSKENQLLINDVVGKLWHFVSYSSHRDIISSALKALSKFDVKEIELKQLPDLYRQNLTLPSTYAKTPEEAARKPEDVLPYIPGECWVQMLQNINHDAMEDAGSLLIEWMRVEVSEYRSGVYIVPDGKTEPANYNYLPANSIVRAIGNAVRLTTIDDMKVPLTRPVLIECLRILGQTYPKPLPPLNWCFLHDLFHKDELIKNRCINLACKQILLSGSALRFVENYVTTFEPTAGKSSEIAILFSNLSFLCKAIAPNLLRPTVTNSLQVAYELATRQNDDVTLLRQLLTDIKDTLLVEDIHDANRTLIGQIIEVFVEQIPGTSETFDLALECIVESPSKYMERISSPSLWWETTQEKFQRAVKVRCLIAKRAEKSPFVWCNECISTAVTLKSVQSYLLINIVEVFKKRRNHIDTGDWILELLGQIQEHLTKEEKSCEQVHFLCDVFIIAVIVLSGHDGLVSPPDQYLISREVRLNLFPNALRELIENCQNITVQLTEWLYHVNICRDIAIPYRAVFYQSLVLLRHEKAFIESARWMKYMSLKYPS